MPLPQPQQAPPPRMRPHPPPPILRPSSTPSTPSLPEGAHNTDHKVVRKPRSRRRGRRAGIGNRAKRALAGDNSPSPGMTFHDATPARCDTPGISSSSTPTNGTPDGFSTPPSSRDIRSGRHEVIFAHLERLERLKPTSATVATFPAEVPLVTPPQTAATCNDSWPSASRTHEWPSTPTLSPTFGRASRRPAYIGSHLPIPTVNLPETKPFPLGTPDFGDIERSLPKAYNADYPHPLTVYASPGVNPATVVASGYAPLLRELHETNPRAAMGGILADCGNEHMTAPALLLAQGNKDGCGIPEKFWLQLSSCAGVKVPIGAVLPAVMAGRSVSPRFLQASSGESPPYSEQSSLTPPPSRGKTDPDTPESPLYSIFAKAQRVALSRSQSDFMNALDHRNASLASQTLNKRRGSLPDLRLGAKQKVDLLSAHDDARSQVYSLVSPHRLERRATDKDLLREILSTRRATEERLPESPTKAGRLPPLQSRRLSLSFDTLSTVEEADDDTRSSPIAASCRIEPIGAERPSRGQLPTLSLHRHRMSRAAEESHSPRTPSRPTSGRPSTAGSVGTMSSLVSPAESFYQPRTPTGTADVFGDVRYSSRSSASDDEFTLAANPSHPKFLSRASPQRVIQESPPESRSSSPTELTKVGLLPRNAWLDPPVSTTTLDFSTGKSIWV